MMILYPNFLKIVRMVGGFLCLISEMTMISGDKFCIILSRLSVLDIIPFILDWKMDNVAVEFWVLWLLRVCLLLGVGVFNKYSGEV